jgi:hypothetical protein
MKPQAGKIVVYFLVLMAGIAVPVGGGLLLGFLGPAPYLLQADQLGPEWAQPREYPDGSTVTVRNYPDDAAARSAVVTVADDIPRSTTTQLLTTMWYTRRDNQRHGLLLPVADRVVQIEAADDQTIKSRLASLPFVRENPQKNIVYVLFTDYLLFTLLGLALYAVLWSYFLFAGGVWAASIPAAAGVEPVPEETLRERLLAVNDLKLPFCVRSEPGGRLVAEWRIADAEWVGILQAGGLHMLHRIYLELDPAAHKVRSLDWERTISWSGDVARVGWGLSFFRGISFFQYERGVQAGLVFKDGRWSTTAYNYRFLLSEMKNPLIEAVVGSGWSFVPVLAFWPRRGGKAPGHLSGNVS